MNIKDLVVGGVAGAALAIVGMHVLGGATAAPAAAAASIQAAGAGASSASAPALSASASAPASSGRGAVDGPPKAAAGLACPPAPAVATADPRKAAASAALAAVVAVDVPAVALSAEHAKLLLSQDKQPPSLPELHARFAGEPLDPAWSQQMEAQLRQALQDAGVQKGFELLAVECRRTLCELRLFGSGPDAPQRWGAIAAQLGQQPWWGQNIAGMSTSTVGLNDRAVIATLLQRAKH